VPYVVDQRRRVEPACNNVKPEDLAFASQVANYWARVAHYHPGDQPVLEGPVRWWASLRGRERLLRLGLNKLAGFRLETRFMRARMQLFKRVMKHHVSLE